METGNRHQLAAVESNERRIDHVVHVASKAVPAESIDDIGESSFSDLCSIFRHVKLEELPVRAS